jgi:Flp pilus assembly pilin Flp
MVTLSKLILSEGQEMKLINIAKKFRADEDGAVTVDWVVLTAAIVGLGIAVLTSVSGGTTSLADKISDELGSMEIMTH